MHNIHLSLRRLVLTVIYFYSTYAASNALAAWRNDVPEIIWAWEYHIPFLAWSIVPYWSLNILYGLGFFLCRHENEQVHYWHQLLWTQTIAIWCFVLFPLQISWEKPPTDGILGLLFASVAMFDQPHNQAPSLHVALAMIVGRFYAQRFPVWRSIIILWFGLIALSVLTTYQHHFIDVPTGILLACFIMWWLPENATSVHYPHHKNHQQTLLYALGTLICLIFSCWWLSVSCAFMCAQCAWFGAKKLPKINGQHDWAVQFLLLPHSIIGRLTCAWILRGHSHSTITTEVALGGIQAAYRYRAVVDLCAEYSTWAKPSAYAYYGVLDRSIPDATLLYTAARHTEHFRQQHGNVLVCCALGYERSAAVVAVWLCVYGNAPSLTQAIAHIQQSRPQARFSSQIIQQIQQAIEFGKHQYPPHAN